MGHSRARCGPTPEHSSDTEPTRQTTPKRSQDPPGARQAPARRSRDPPTTPEDTRRHTDGRQQGCTRPTPDEAPILGQATPKTRNDDASTHQTRKTMPESIRDAFGRSPKHGAVLDSTLVDRPKAPARSAAGCTVWRTMISVPPRPGRPERAQGSEDQRRNHARAAAGPGPEGGRSWVKVGGSGRRQVLAAGHSRTTRTDRRAAGNQ